MKKIISVVILLVATTLSEAGSLTKDIRGTWSNKKEGFGICTLSFRSDGKGFINASGVGGVIIRWQEDKEGIAITIASPPECPTAYAFLSQQANELTFAPPKGEKQLFWRISQKEPPDYEKQARIAEEKERAKRNNKTVSITNILNSTSSVVDFVTAFEPSGPMDSLQITLKSVNQPIIIRKGSSLTTLRFTTFTAHRELRTTDLFSEWRWSAAPPAGNFSVEQQVPKEDVEQFNRWLEKNNIMTEKYPYYNEKTIWGVKSYYKTCIACIRDNPTQTGDALRFLLEEIFKEENPPYEMVIIRK